MHIAHINLTTKKEQTVAEHCQSVGDYCKYFGTKIGIQETAALAGYLHDFGKDMDKFEVYLRYSIAHPDDFSQKGKINHSSAGAKYVFENYWEGDQFQRLTAQILALVICGHHGGLSDIISLDGLDDFAKRINPDKDISFDECLQNFTKNYIKIPQLAEYFFKSRDEIVEIISRMKETKIFDSFTMQLVVKYMFSCLIDADRLDTYNFMEDKQQGETDINTSNLWIELSGRLEVAMSKFTKNNKVDLLRGEISDACKNFAYNRPGIYQLCVPTGGGKTLSSLRYALEHASIKEFKKERIFYIIPYTTIIDQNARVIKNILECNDVILEHHSNLVADNEHQDYKLLTERWSSPIILTTMVQFLNTLFAGGTQDVRRMHNLANSIIILDEIQSVPIKCIHMLNSALNFLSKLCNTTVILCTATQPLLAETDKPLQLSTPVNIIENVEEKFRQFKRVNLVDRRINGGYSTTELADFVLERMESLNNTLVVLNTKNSVKDLFNQLCQLNKVLPSNERFSIFHLSTNMCPKHRVEVLDEIKGKLDKDRVICISTQLIEAGVDISFQCVVRAIAGFDSIAQAAGRCNRHGEKPCSNVYIVNIKEESLSKLPDIKEGKACTERILDEFRDNPESFDGDLLSPKVNQRYYQYYFYNRKKEMNYNMKDKNATLYDLLSTNTKGINAFNDRNGCKPQYPINQAFKTAGENFSVIENKTKGVIVPFGEGRRLIAKINGNCNLGQLKNFIKEAQQYSVNLYENDIKKIDNGIFPLKNGGILALREEFYDDDLGVITEGKFMEALIK